MEGRGEVAAAGSRQRRGEDDDELEKELQRRRASRATGAGNRGAMGIGRVRSSPVRCMCVAAVWEDERERLAGPRVRCRWGLGLRGQRWGGPREAQVGCGWPEV